MSTPEPTKIGAVATLSGGHIAVNARISSTSRATTGTLKVKVFKSTGPTSLATHVLHVKIEDGENNDPA